MKQLLTLLFTFLASTSFAQDQYNYVQYNKLTELKGTDFVMATVENRGKITAQNKFLLFINTQNGTTRKIDFPKSAYIEKIEQIKIDSLGINKVVVAAKTVNLDGSKSIDWGDPQQLIVLSADGQEKMQITDDKFFVRTWIIHYRTGAMVITGHYDSDSNGKYDKTDRSEILVYDLKTMKLLTKI